jgi:hypothetical protein
MSQDSKFIQEFQNKLNEMTNSNSTANQKILSELQDIKGKVTTVLQNIKSLKQKIVDCDQQTKGLKQQVQQNQENIQSSASPDQIAGLQQKNAELTQQIGVIEQTKKQAMDAIQQSIDVLNKYTETSNADVSSIKLLIDDIKNALTNASSSNIPSGDSGGITGFLGSLFGSTPAPLAPSGQPQMPLLAPTDLEKARIVAAEEQRKRENEQVRQIEQRRNQAGEPQKDQQQILEDRLYAQKVENMQRKMGQRNIERDEQMARELQTPIVQPGGKKIRKSKKRLGTKKNKSKRRHNKRSLKKK